MADLRLDDLVAMSRDETRGKSTFVNEGKAKIRHGGTRARPEEKGKTQSISKKQRCPRDCRICPVDCLFNSRANKSRTRKDITRHREMCNV